MPVFIGQIRSVKKFFFEGEYNKSPILLGVGAIIEIRTLPQEENGFEYVTVKEFGYNVELKMEWSELEQNSEACQTHSQAKAFDVAHRIWNNYKEGDKTFSRSLRRYYKNYSTIAIAASNSIAKNEANNWSMTESEFMDAFVARAQGLPT